MKRSLLHYIFFFFFMLPVALAQGQNEFEKPTVAVMPFNADAHVNATDAGALSQRVETVFANSKRFTMIERANFKQVFEEIEAQKGEMYLHSDQLAEQGKLMGASLIVTGNIRSAGSEGTTFNIKLIDVSTGVQIATESISDKDNAELIDIGLKTASLFTKSDEVKDASSSGAAGIAGSALLNIDKRIRQFINKWYPLRYEILEISESKGKTAKKIVVAGGTAEGLDANIKTMYLIDESALGEGEKRRVRRVKLGVLTVEEIQGEVTICKVKSGGSGLAELLQGDHNIYVSTNDQ
ncbi:TolB-like protein [Dyadobacter jejuensis]|uniref:TolB-like protein n=1 Tax=Dyadobacter jejuensis TaxID=1082580 RepID=A0A316AI33_9BACT|nr:CsgG/HfaB family protein [Dyadobacter jejuensis]PWJ57372.1 TolB-like protein [Dyadobacter jejuensis]